LFFSTIAAKWYIFELQFDKLNGLSLTEIIFFATKKLMNIIIQPKDFLPNGRLAHIYIPNYLYLPDTLMDALDIRDTCPNNIMYSNKRFYIWYKARIARAKATQTRMLGKYRSYLSHKSVNIFMALH